MKKIYTAIAAGAFLLSSAADLNAQCGGSRFHNFVFPSHTLTSNVQYGSNLKSNGTTQNLMMDIYEPQGDTGTAARPLVIVAHGGSFIGGSKTGTDVVPLCKDLAKLGYVAASIEYRVGMTNFPFPGPDSADAGAAVMRAVHDGRAAVRYFRQNAAAGGNTYRIDPNNIYFAGVSAGGFIALHLAYMDQLAEFPAYVDTTAQPGLHGGIEGQSGNPGYSSDVKAIINICGAIGDTAWIHAGDEPLLSFHGTNDGTVPYGSALITLAGVYPLLKVHGSYSIAARANEVGLENCFEIWEGQDHVPEVGTTAAALAFYDSTIVMSRNFLEHQVCGTPLNCSYTTPLISVVGIDEASIENKISVYPNPATTSVTIDLSVFENAPLTVDVYDATGKRVKSIVNPKTSKLVIPREGAKSGIYMITITSNGKHYSKRVVLQ